VQRVRIRISRYREWVKWCGVVPEPDDDFKSRQGKGKAKRKVKNRLIH